MAETLQKPHDPKTDEGSLCEFLYITGVQCRRPAEKGEKLCWVHLSPHRRDQLIAMVENLDTFAAKAFLYYSIIHSVVWPIIKPWFTGAAAPDRAKEYARIETSLKDLIERAKADGRNPDITSFRLQFDTLTRDFDSLAAQAKANFEQDALVGAS